MKTDESLYIERLLTLYLELPETPSRVSRYDRQLAFQLYEQEVPIERVEAALLLASVRRRYRPPSSPTLGPIRSLHYFLPVIEEVSANQLAANYVQYLRYKLASQTECELISK